MDIDPSVSLPVEYGSFDLRSLLEHSPGMALLEKAAKTGNEDAFVRAIYQVNWPQRPASDFVHAVHLALAAGAHLAARELAALGASKYATHSELRKMAHILAPPQVIKTDLPSTSWVQANRAWLRTHAEQYKGQWVALKDGELVGVAETASKLKTHLESLDGIMVTKVS